MKKKTELLRCTILLLISLGAGLALSLFPDTAARGAARGLNVCLSVLVPSLFPFLVLSVFLVRSGAAALLGKLLEGPMRFLIDIRIARMLCSRDPDGNGRRLPRRCAGDRRSPASGRDR